jgi:O-antigen/teichoic acid export membrane protein
MAARPFAMASYCAQLITRQLRSTPRLERSWPRLARYLRLIEPLQQRVVEGATWSILGAGLTSGLTMAGNIACARVLGAAIFGELAIVISTTNLFTTLFTSGVSMTATRYVAEHRRSNPSFAGMIVGLSRLTSLGVGTAAALLVVVLAPWMSRTVLGAPELAGALCLGAAAMFFAALNGSQMGALSGLEAFNQIAFANLVRGIGIIVFVTGGAVIAGLTGALSGYVAAGAAAAIFYHLAVRRTCASNAITISYRLCKDGLRVLSRFTLPVLISTFSFTPAAWWSNVLLATRSGYAEAGVFNAILHWQMFITFFSNAIAQIGLPMLSNLRGERNSASYKTCLAVTFVLTSVPAIAIAVPVALCSGSILHLYGPTFQHGSTALMLISLSAVLSAINIPVGHAIWSLDATTPAVLLSLLRGGVLVLASFALAHKGATGMAAAYVIMGIVQTVATAPVMLWLVRRKLVSATASEPEEAVLA